MLKTKAVITLFVVLTCLATLLAFFLTVNASLS